MDYVQALLSNPSAIILQSSSATLPHYCKTKVPVSSLVETLLLSSIHTTAVSDRSLSLPRSDCTWTVAERSSTSKKGPLR